MSEKPTIKKDDNHTLSQIIVGLMNQRMLAYWGITESVLDDNDPLKQIADVIRVKRLDNEKRVVFQNSFLMSVFESLSQDDPSRFRFQVPKTFTTKFVDAVLSEAEAYQKKHNSNLPPIDRDTIEKDLSGWLELAGNLAAPLDLTKMGINEGPKYGHHMLAYLAMVSAYRENRNGFLEFIIKDLNLPESRLAYVWDKLHLIFGKSPDYIKNINPEKFFHYVRTAVKRGFYDFKRKHEKDPILRKMEDRQRKEGEKGVDNLFVEIFSFHEGFDELYTKSMNETYNSFEDLSKLEEIIAINQRCDKLEKVKPERVTEVKELITTRAIFELSYKDTGVLLGWPKKKVDRVRKFYNRHKESFKKI